MNRERDSEVIVIGLGGMGLAACRELARRGVRVLGLEQHTIGHALGSSHGGTRVVRQAYFEHPDYVPLLRRAMDGFLRLEQESGLALLERCGVVIVGGLDSSLISASAGAAAAHGIEVERLEGTVLRARLPQFFAKDDVGPSLGLLEPGGGFVRPERVLRALAMLSMRDGARLRERVPVRSWRTTSDGVEVEAGDGRFRADRVVITAGAWNPAVLVAREARPGPLPLTAVRQVQSWLRPHEPRLADAARFPAWLVDRGEGAAPLYGVPIDAAATPDEPGFGCAKVAVHGEGEPCDPDRVDRTVSDAELTAIEALARQHLPGLPGRLESARVCLYTNSPDGHFLIDRHPLDERVAIAAGFSGHGFKFVPVVGEALADLATTGRTDLPIGFLAASRFS